MEVQNNLKLITDECINCGFCEAVCPTIDAFSYNMSYGARGRINLAKKDFVNNKNVDKFVDKFYSCLECNACLSVCPANISAGKASHLSREIILSKSGMKKKIPIAYMMVKVIMKYESPLAMEKKADKWFDGLKFYENSDLLFYGGQMFFLSAYSSKFAAIEEKMGKKLSNIGARLISIFPHLMKILSYLIKADETLYKNSFLNIYELLTKAGYKLKRLKNEPYPGTFIFDLGYNDEFKIYANKICNRFKSEGIKKIVTIDPHTYNLLKYEYPKFVPDFNLEVLYYLDLIKDLKFKKLDLKTVIHEPCHLARGHESYEIPSKLLSNSTEMKLPRHNGINTMCCGGPDELIFPSNSNKITKRRVDELKAEGNRKIVTSCPICLSNINKYSQGIDISSILLQAIENSK